MSKASSKDRKRMKANSGIGLMVPDVHLFHDKRKCKKFIKNKMGAVPQFYDTEGQMFYSDGVVAILMQHKGSTETELSLLVHEAYHAAVAHMEWIGEDKAGEETMAYLIQTIANGLFAAHERLKRKERMVD